MTSKFPVTDKWYRYVGDENMGKMLDLREGHSLVLKIPTHELQACKWQWYKTLQWIGKTHEYRLSMDMPRATFTILRRPTAPIEPIEAIVEGPPQSFESAEGGPADLLTGSQADLVRLTIEHLEGMTPEDMAEAITKCLGHPETLPFIKKAVQKHFGLTTDPSPSITPLDEREPDEDFIDSLTKDEPAD